MGWPRRIIAIRHARSKGNDLTTDERAQLELATHDYPLTEVGIKQATLTGEWLRGLRQPIDARFVSYYRRSKETMSLIAPGEEVFEDPRLAEAQRGIWHTLTAKQVEEQYPGEEDRKRREGLYHYRPIAGENWPDIELRIHSFLSTLSLEYEGKNVLMVVHGHWLILFQRLIDRLSIAEAVRRYHDGTAENASVTIYESCRKNGFARLEPTMQNFVPWKGKI